MESDEGLYHWLNRGGEPVVDTGERDEVFSSWKKHILARDAFRHSGARLRGGQGWTGGQGWIGGQGWTGGQRWISG